MAKAKIPSKNNKRNTLIKKKPSRKMAPYFPFEY